MTLHQPPRYWAQVHVGDVVRGADQREWTVIERGPGLEWMAGGMSGAFVLVHGERRQDITPRLSDPVQFVRSADHDEVAAAVNVLMDNGIGVKLVGEAVVEEPEQDEFESAQPNGGKRQLIKDGRYALPHPKTGKEMTFTRASNVAKILADTWALNQWDMRCVAKGMGMRSDLATAAAAADLEQDKSTLNDLVRQAKDVAEGRKASNLGTAFHQVTEKLDLGQPAHVPAELAPAVSAYQDMLKMHGLRVFEDWVERVVVCPQFGSAGTLDRLLMQPRGNASDPRAPLVVSDLKSGKNVHYSWLEFCVSQAIYANATHYWDVEKETYYPMPEGIDKSIARILHIPLVDLSRAQLYNIDIAKGLSWVRLADTVRKARNAAKKAAWTVDPEPHVLAEHLVRKAQSVEELSALWKRFHPQDDPAPIAGAWTEEVNAAAKDRWNELYPPAAQSA